MGRHTRLASAHELARLVKKPRRLLMTELVAILPPLQLEPEAPAVATSVSEPISTTLVTALRPSEPIVVALMDTVTSGDAHTIPSPLAMMLATATPRNPTMG